MNPCCFLRVLACLIGAMSCASPTQAATEPAPAEPGKLRRAIDSLLPLSMQRWPTMHFTAITEMTIEGRKRRIPTPEQPMYYYAPPATFAQGGWLVAAGEKAPPAAELEALIKKALAANGYVPISENQRPDVLIVFTFGSHGTDIASTAVDDLPTSAEELLPLALRDPTLFRDVIDRAVFVAGETFARELKAAMDAEVRNMNTNASMGRLGNAETMPLLPVNPDFGSPYQIFVRGGNSARMAQLAELAFRTIYFVTASAYDFAGVETRRKIPLWQTRMTVDAQGVSLREVLGPLIVNTGSFLGRDHAEAVVVKKQMNRDGRVEIGTPIVVEDPKPAARPEPAPKR